MVGILYYSFFFSNLSPRDTLEQIDIARLLIEKYPNVSRSPTLGMGDPMHMPAGTTDVLLCDQLGRRHIRSSERQNRQLLGHRRVRAPPRRETPPSSHLFFFVRALDSGHSLGNSIAALRQFHALGVRYLTLTHVCHNAFADSAGFTQPQEPLHGGLSALGYRLIDEMNRLGVLVDLSHTSDATAAQAMNHSRAPVMWSHSSAKGVHDVARNVPDHLLALLGTKKGKKDGIVMVCTSQLTY